MSRSSAASSNSFNDLGTNRGCVAPLDRWLFDSGVAGFIRYVNQEVGKQCEIQTGATRKVSTHNKARTRESSIVGS